MWVKCHLGNFLYVVHFFIFVLRFQWLCSRSLQLHIAAANGYVEVLDFLLGMEDIDLDVQDNEGWTPFMAAVCWNQKEAMEKLAEKGADMDMKNMRGETAYGKLV